MPEPIRLVDWDLATATAIRLAPRGPVVSRAEAFEAVAQLRDLTVEAEDHVAALTGMAAPHAHQPASVVDRAGWVRGNVGGFELVMTPLLEKLAAKRTSGLAGPLGGAVVSRASGVQIGVMLAYLSGKVLGQYEIFLPPVLHKPDEPDTPATGRLTLVAPNIVAVERMLGLDPRDFRLWVCVHEVTHRTQFTAVPWLRAHVQDEISAFLMASDLDPAAMLGRLRAAGGAVRGSVGTRLRRGAVAGDASAAPGDAGPEFGLLDLVANAEQRAVLDRLTAVMTLLEGHGEYVMNGVGPAVIPTVEEIGRRFGERRRAHSPADRVLRKLFGLDLKAKQYAQGAAFVRAVVDRVGMAGFNRVWTSPNTLPTKAEIADPSLWLARVPGTTGVTPD